MRTKQQSIQGRVPRPSILIVLTAITLFSCSQKAFAQWSTSGHINNTNNGNAGVRTTSSGVKLDILSSANLNARFGSTAGPHASNTTCSSMELWSTSGTNIFYSGGNVGIGTSTPTTASGYAALSLNNTTGALVDFMTNNALKARLQSDGTTFYFNNLANGPIQIYTNSTERMRIDSSGNVAIGTTNPLALLDVRNSDGLFYAGFGYGTNKETFVRSGSSSTGVLHLGDLNTTKTLLQENSGNVGIGTATPNSQYKLDVGGNINSSGTITGNNIVAKYQDVAEWVESSQKLPAGTVVVVDHTKSNQVIASSQPYDTRVAGVISAQPGIALGTNDEGKVLVATTGRVRIKVDASRGSIQVGDLLVTSETPGVAMKSQPINVGGVKIHRPGTLIGKALEPLQNGTGEILVLLSLQ